MKNLTKVYIVFLFFLFWFSNTYGQKYTINGIITDAETGESLPGANIYTNSLNGTISNSYGFYSIEADSGMVTIYYSFIGFDTKSISFHIQSNTILHISLHPKLTQLEEVLVVAERKKTSIAEISTQRVSIQEIKQITGVIGEKDILRSIQLLPGINTANEGVNSLSVRGGASDQNLFLLDEAVIYNPNHALSLFSVFNPDAISSVTLYKAAFPSKYGGRLSSIMDIRMKEGNNKKTQINGGIGLIASRLSVEGPIKKDTASFIISARYGYLGATANIFASVDKLLSRYGSDFEKGNDINFFDVNAKINYRPNNKNHIYLSTYIGNDNFFFKNFSLDYDLKWGNIGGTFRWNHIFGPKFFNNITLAYSRYYFQYTLIRDIRNFLWEADMNLLQIKSDTEHYLADKIKLNYGVFMNNMNSLPGKISPANHESQTIPFSMDRSGSIELGGYTEAEIKIFPFLNVRAGIRFTSFNELGKKLVYDYFQGTDIVIDSTLYRKGSIITSSFQPEPRIVLNVFLKPDLSVSASYNKVYQNLHLLSNSSIGMPTDVWISSGKHISPQSSEQYVLGIHQDLRGKTVEFSIEGYYKNIKNIIDYRDNAELFLNDRIETQILPGKARAYGLELYVNKKSGVFNGWFSYTLSKVQNKINGINNNKFYPAVYDKPHNLRFLANYKYSETWSLSASFSLSSGSNMTIPEGSFHYSGSLFFLYSERNAYRVPSFHQLDISATFRPLKKRRWKSEWIFSINNVYNRKNVFSLYAVQDKDMMANAKFYKIYLYGVLPSINYNFKF